jgi:hypothetical protein
MKLEIKGTARRNYRTNIQSPKEHSHASKSDKKRENVLYV